MASTTVSLDSFLDREPKQGYNCLSLASEVWERLTGERLADRLTVTMEHGSLAVSGMGNFTKIDAPESPCLVVMQRYRLSPHIGVFYDGRVIHLSGRGAQYQPLVVASFGFKGLRFYK